MKLILENWKKFIIEGSKLSDWGNNNTPPALQKEKEIESNKDKPEEA